MLVSDFNYDLPDENIAKRPPKIRGTTRLLVLNRKKSSTQSSTQEPHLQDSHYANLADFLEPGDLIILNDSRVMRSRVFTELPDGRPRELVVLEKHKNDLNRVMYRGKLHAGDILTVKDASNKISPDNAKTTDTITVQEILDGGIATVTSSRPLKDIVEDYGNVPLPPYLHRDADADDIKRYQTVWAKQLGSAAAPTASLNMTKKLLDKLRAKNIQIEYLTLHVGLGTFLPIRSDEVENHHMHSEWFSIPEQTIQAIKETKERGHKVIAVGTTVTRTLEFWAKTGITEGEDDIFIYPGFKFQVVDHLLTNFHAPKSTVLMLAAAFADWNNLKPAYDHAVQSGYQLLSYGDSMLIL